VPNQAFSLFGEGQHDLGATRGLANLTWVRNTLHTATREVSNTNPRRVYDLGWIGFGYMIGVGPALSLSSWQYFDFEKQTLQWLAPELNYCRFIVWHVQQNDQLDCVAFY
jgi:hypothetical protein